MPQRLRFLLAGGFNTALGYAIFSAMFLLVGRWVHYLVIGLVAHALSVASAFVVHRKLVFRATDDWRPAFVRFCVSQAVSLGVGMAALYALVEFGHCNPLAAQFAVTVISVALNYVLHRHFSFRDAVPAAGGRVGEPAVPAAAAGIALWLIGLMYLAPVMVMTVWTARTQGIRGVVSLLLAAMLIACLVAAATRTIRGFFLVQWPFVLLSVVFCGYAVAFGMAPGRTLAHLVAGASLEEVQGLLGFAVGAWCAAGVACWGLAYLGLVALLPRRRIFDAPAQRVTRMLVLALLPMSAYAAVNPSQMIDGLALDPIVGSLMFLGGDVPRARAELRGASVLKVPYGATRAGGEEVHILVVGESARRDSWSIYGYRRPTTPRLEALRGEMVLLRNATADANLTDWAVPILLTGIAPDKFSAARIRGNVFDLAREAGYHTAWLVNQDIGISNSVGVVPDVLEYPPDLKANVNGRHTLDEALLPAFERQIANSGSARFIGIHMMGSHWEYFRRYPPKFQVFGTADEMQSMSTLTLLLDEKTAQSAVVDAYDNTVRYTDWFLAQLIQRAQRLNVPATLIFFPDHGEDLKLLDGATGHGGPVYTRHDFEIPAFVWANAAYRTRHPDKWAAIEANAARDIRSHNLFATEADLMGIRWPGARAGSSFASADFTADPAMARVAGGVLIHPE